MNEFQGRPLAALLRAKMNRDDLSLEQLGNRLFVGGSYLSQLLRGVKPMAAVSEGFLRSSAEYLGMPAVTAYLLAGKLRAEDFFDVHQPDWGECLNKALRTVCESRVAANAAVTEAMLREMPSEVKLLLVLLFEEATARFSPSVEHRLRDPVAFGSNRRGALNGSGTAFATESIRRILPSRPFLRRPASAQPS